MNLQLTKLENYKGFYTDTFKGNAYQIFNEKGEIGFVLLELFTIDDLKCGTFHTLILPSYRSFKTWLGYFDKVKKLCFNSFGLDKIYTLADDGMKNSLSRYMTDEKRIILGFNVFSLTKE